MTRLGRQPPTRLERDVLVTRRSLRRHRSERQQWRGGPVQGPPLLSMFKPFGPPEVISLTESKLSCSDLLKSTPMMPHCHDINSKDDASAWFRCNAIVFVLGGLYERTKCFDNLPNTIYYSDPSSISISPLCDWPSIPR